MKIPLPASTLSRPLFLIVAVLLGLTEARRTFRSLTWTSAPSFYELLPYVRFSTEFLLTMVKFYFTLARWRLLRIRLALWTFSRIYFSFLCSTITILIEFITFVTLFPHFYFFCMIMFLLKDLLRFFNVRLLFRKFTNLPIS